MKFAKNMFFLSLMGLSLISLGGGLVGPVTRGAGRTASQATRAGMRGAQKTAGLGWRAAQGAVGAAGAAGTTFLLTGELSEKPDMPKPGSDGQLSESSVRADQAEQANLDEEEGEEEALEPKPLTMPYMGGGFAGSPAPSMRERDEQEQVVDLLVESVKKHEVAVVQKLIELGVPVNQKDQHGSLPLTVATVLGFTDIVTMLLEAGARVDLMDRSIIESAGWGLKNILQFALSTQAELRFTINNQDKFGQTLLMHAVTENDLNKVRKYLEWGAQVDLADNNGNTPLLRALVLGNLEMADILFAAGADVTRANKAGDTPRQFIFSLLLEKAISAGDLSAVAELIAQAKAEGLELDTAGVEMLEKAQQEQSSEQAK